MEAAGTESREADLKPRSIRICEQGRSTRGGYHEDGGRYDFGGYAAAEDASYCTCESGGSGCGDHGSFHDTGSGSLSARVGA